MSGDDNIAYPPIGDYGLIADGHSAALVSSSGSIDWCCMPRMDAASTFGRLLDWGTAGHFSISPGEARPNRRAYVTDTMVLETTFSTNTGDARLLDCFTVREGGRTDPHRQLLRVVEGMRGRVDLDIDIVPRFDYGSTKPWLRMHRPHLWSATGGDDAIVITTDADLDIRDGHDLAGHVTVAAGQRSRLSITWYRPEQLDPEPPPQPDGAELDERLATTVAWWQAWSARTALASSDAADVRRSALVLKSLVIAPTGAIAAAPTTSLPEAIGGTRNWDYRYSWIRDSQFTVRSLGALGYEAEADGFRRFIERTAAGSPHDLQIMYGLGGSRRLDELELPLAGYQGSRPVRVGNAASGQLQLDAYGELLDLAWRWHQRGRSPDDDYWRFLVGLVDTAADRWEEPDHGLWEMRGEPRHFVHSKAMCWTALDRGIRLAHECLRQAPSKRWSKIREDIRASIEAHGFDAARSCYLQAYGADALDASLLLLPSVDYLAYDDPRMISTTEAITRELDDNGFLRRYRGHDGTSGEEGVFVACTFWLAECLAKQGQTVRARDAYERASAAANDLGLYAEEYDPRHHRLLGNFPQGLSHLSHIAAAVALAERERHNTERA